MDDSLDSRGTRPVVLLSPTAGVLVAGCLLVATAVYLGAEWLRTPTLGVPVGVWGVVLATALVAFLSRPRTVRYTGSVWPRFAPFRWRAPIRRVFGIPVRVAAWYGVSEQRLREIEDLCNARLDRLRLLASPLRIGLKLPGELDVAVRAADSPLEIHWVSIADRTRAGDDERDCRELGLDAIVHATPGVLSIVTPENPGRDAAWYDWSRPRPLSYSSVFPGGGRVDPGRIQVADADTLTPEDAPALRALVEAAAVLSRTPVRLSLADRLLGRRWWGARADESAPSVEFTMLRLARFLTYPEAGGGRAGHLVLAPAARAVSAWLASAPADVDAETRRLGVEAAARILPDEPESHLRLAAVRIADGYDQPALEALVTADRILRAQTVVPFADQLAFIEAEAALPHGDPLTTGRVAAGVALVAACTAPDRLAALREDLMDDLRYSGWLVGRDQDRALILNVFRALERARAGEARAAA